MPGTTTFGQLVPGTPAAQDVIPYWSESQQTTLSVTVSQLAGAGITSTNVNTNFNVSSEIGTYFVDTTSGAVTGTLPSTPSRGDKYSFVDQGGNALTNPISINGNGKLIMGQSVATGFIQTNYGFGSLQFNGTSWSQVN